MIEGVDYAWSRPDIAQLAAAGKRFACRYGGAGSVGKQLDATEAQALGAASIAVVANVEGAADGLLGGWSAGADWARRADVHFRACGMPPDRPIYLSVDFDVQSGQWSTVTQALRGAASVIGLARVGVYGGRRAIEWARRDGVARWFWQTFAWSGGVWVPGNHIEQYKNGVSLAGATLDLDRALTSDYGQWTIGDDMAWTNEQVAKLLRDNEYEIWRVLAMAHMEDTYSGGPQQGQKVPLTAAVKGLVAAVAELKARPPVEAAPVDVAALAEVLKPHIADVVRAELAAQRAAIDTDTKDTVVDALTGGAEAVREDT